MKTEPKEALKFLYSVEDPADNISMHLTPKDKADHVCRLAFKEGQSSPKIKQLEWEDNENCLTKGITARTSFCRYQTMELSNGNSSLFTDNRIICQDFPIDYIKQYAQADFENRVKQCLEL